MTPPGPLVFSIHGIRTRGVWQKSLTEALGDAGWRHYPVDYGFFRAMRMLRPGARRRQVDWFRDLYAQKMKAESDIPSVIAHSFGTYIVTEAMRLYPDIRFRSVILCGSIVRQDYPWSQVVQRRQVERVLNDSGRRDLWSSAVQWVVEDAGPSGVSGFSDSAAGKVVDRCNPDWSHSDYFFDLNYRNSWIPFLTSGETGPAGLERPQRVNWRYRIVAGSSLVLVGVSAVYFGSRLFIPAGADTGERRARVVASHFHTDAGSSLGFSLWRMRPADASAQVKVRGLKHREDPDGNREWTPERITLTQAVSEGEAARISIEAMQPGYLYVINRDAYADGTTSAPTLIFPTLRIRGGKNLIERGRPIELPGMDDHPPAFTVERTRRDQMGILLTFILAPHPLPEIMPAQSEQAVARDVVARWEREWGTQVEHTEDGSIAGKLYGTAESNAASDPARPLTAEDLPPVTLFHRAGHAGEPIVATAVIALRPSAAKVQ